MEGKIINLVGSKLVPSVQELAKDCPKEIPERYIRNDQDPPLAADDENLQLPTINMEALISGDGVELEKLHSACQEWGFFQLINHGISSSLLKKVKQETQEFFNLPLEEKRKYWQTPTDAEGFGQAFVKSDDQKLDWADMFFLTTLPKHLRRPNSFPMLPLPFRDALENYSTEVDKLSRKILDFMAKALNFDNDGNVFGEISQAMRMNYYPPCSQSEKVIGIVPHTDATALITILLQLNEIEGLQINKDNKWIAVDPPPDAFIVNIGDILEIMSNGMYRSVMHRAVVNATKERLSIATFVSPSLDREIGPNPRLINSINRAKFKRISMKDYWKGFVDRPLDGRRYLDGVRIVDDDA
ncbi:protein SRG1-like [Chenopodium quinoa]|uniref:protein SRG1-like n=1 Tax=Chenopodium quinoa TaxID=63459 RepID=UPI000B77F373|nr:protein SRG1-like [Chenopodium quinoa]